MESENSKKISSADGQEEQTSDAETKQEEISQTTDKSDLKDDFEQKNFSNNDIQVNENETDQRLYEEILEKLDIKQKTEIQEESIKKNNFINQNVNPEENHFELKIKKALSEDFNKLQTLVKLGLINSNQEQNFKKQVLQKAFDKLVQAEKIKRKIDIQNQNNEKIPQPLNKNEVFEEFSKSNPNFFSSNGRKEVLKYLQSDDVFVGKEELNKISNIIRVVEQAAIERYLQKAAHEKTLTESNKNAKEKLTANAQKTNFNKNLSKSFTREQIGKMSSSEFAKYEPLIMEQLRKRQIN